MSGGVLPIATGSVVKAVPSPFPSLGVTSTVILSPFLSPSVLNCGTVAPGAGTLLTSHLYRYVIGSPSLSSPWTSTRSSISIMALDGKIRAERTTGGWLPVDAPLAATGAPPAVETGAWGFDSPLQPQRARITKRGAANTAPLPILFSVGTGGAPWAGSPPAMTEWFVPMPLLHIHITCRARTPSGSRLTAPACRTAIPRHRCWPGYSR